MPDGSVIDEIIFSCFGNGELIYYVFINILLESAKKSGGSFYNLKVTPHPTHKKRWGWIMLAQTNAPL